MEADKKFLNYLGLDYFFDKLKKFFIPRPKIGIAGLILVRLANGDAAWQDFPHMLVYQGTKSTLQEILTITNPSIGDVWSDGTTGDEYFCKTVNSTTTLGTWEPLGPMIVIGTLDTNNSSSQVVPTTPENLNGTIKLHKISKTGNYADLIDKPTIPAALVNSDWNATSGITLILNKPSLAAVATSGSYSDLTNTPSFAPVATTGSYLSLSDVPALAIVATSGAYSDLVGTPSLDYLPLVGGVLTGQVYYRDESGQSATTIVTHDKKYNWLEVDDNSNSVVNGAVTLSIIMPSYLPGRCEVIYAIKNNNTSGGNNITLNLPSTGHNMCGSSLTIPPQKIAEVVFTFWSTTEVSFNGGVEV